MAGTTAQQDAFAARVVVPDTALTMLAVQVGSNDTRDALVLSFVTTLPWFVALGAFVTFLAAPGAGSLLGRYGPDRTVHPATCAVREAGAANGATGAARDSLANPACRGPEGVSMETWCMSIEEIAEVTGTSPGDGRKDRVLARAWLRRELNDIAEPHE